MRPRRRHAARVKSRADVEAPSGDTGESIAHPVPARRVRPTAAATFVALRSPGFAHLWGSGWLWNITRWMCLFLCSYIVNEQTGSPFLVQLVGASFFFPMFVGGILGGVISDRVDRMRLIKVVLAVMALLSLAMASVVLAGGLTVWMLYPFVFAIGIGGVIDFTSRRTLIYEVVGPERATNALALESMALSGGNMVGALAGGAFIQYLGFGATFMAIGVAYVLAFLLMVSSGVRATRPAETARPTVVADLREGFGLLGRSGTLVSLLAVTVIFNFFYFAYVPLVPVFAERLEAGALLAGLLGSAPGLGMLLGTLVIAAVIPSHRGRVYVGGCVVAFSAMFVFAATPWYPIALVLIFFAGLGQAGFATMQAVLTMDAADEKTRGRAMGLLSMAIGSLPIGMIVLGTSADLFGHVTAVMMSCAAGGATLVAALWWRPQSLRMR